MDECGGGQRTDSSEEKQETEDRREQPIAKHRVRVDTTEVSGTACVAYEKLLRHPALAA